MFLLKEKFFIIIGLFAAAPCVASQSNNDSNLLVELGPKQVSEFKGIGDAEVLHWPVFPSMTKFVLRFSGTVNESGEGISVHCPDGNISAVVRRQGIPLPNPRNAVIPDNTFIHDDGVIYSGYFLVSWENPDVSHDVEVVMRTSENSHYFAAMFLPYDLERVEIAGLTKDCHYYATLKVFAFNISDALSYVETNYSVSSVSSGKKLTRKQSEIFAVIYMPSSNLVSLGVDNTSKFLWDVYPVTDSGGTLKIKLKSLKQPSSLTSVITTTYGCLSNEPSRVGKNCSGDLLRLNQSHLGKEMLWNVPFPTAGTWMLEMWFDCSSSSNCSDVVQSVEVSVAIGTCIENCQSNQKHGDCVLHRTVDLLFTACRCKTGWMGLACNDGRFALSYYTQLLHTLLLTLSNMMFIPCVMLAIYRKYYTEALVYFFVAFMSTFYHACDQPGIVVYCLLPYDTLQFCDFLGSISAVWFTLIALAQVSIPLESWLHALGCLGVAVAVSYKRFSLWTTVVPAVVGLVIVVIKWGLRCHQTKHCYPGRKKTLFSIVPGLIFACVGISLYAFVETSANYYIVHSIWHILMACAVLFLLPVSPKENGVKKSYSIVKSSSVNPAFLHTGGNNTDNISAFHRRDSNSSSKL